MERWFAARRCWWRSAPVQLRGSVRSGLPPRRFPESHGAPGTSSTPESSQARPGSGRCRLPAVEERTEPDPGHVAPMTATVALLLGVVTVAGAVGTITEMRKAQRARRHLVQLQAGASRVDPAREPAGIDAALVDWPGERSIAMLAGQRLGLVVIECRLRERDAVPVVLDRMLRAHERSWQVDVDTWCLPAFVDGANGLVRAAARMLGELDAALPGVVRLVGIAACPDDGHELLDVLDAARERLVPPRRVHEAAAAISAAASSG